MANSLRLWEEDVRSPPNCEPLDVSFLNQNTFGDAALRDEIIGLFRAQLEAVRTQLSLPVDKPGWAHLTHTMKGAASAVGAQQLAALAETWGRQSPPATQTARFQFESQLQLRLNNFNRIADRLGD